MATFHVLIVEDQRELSRMIQSGLQTLDATFEIVNVPSGEEALLVGRSHSFDLLIIDVLLPGMSGLELMAVMKRLMPQAKTLLITGSVDNEVRRQVANAGAEAFFFKPVALSEILEAVQRVTGLLEPTIPPEVLEPAEPAESLSDRLAALRKEVGAGSVILLDERGAPLVQAGDYPESEDLETQIPALMAAFSAAERVAQALGNQVPDDLLVFSGNQYDLYLTHIGADYALVVTVKKDTPGSQLQHASQAIKNASPGLLEALAQMGVPVDTGPLPTTPPEEPEEAVPEDEEGAPELDALFDQLEPSSLQDQEVDKFWEIPQKSLDTGSLHPDDLSYDQARKLGLAPDDQKD